MWTDLFTAFALVLVIEGMLPFVRPDAWRRAMQQAASLDDRALRLVGAASMVIGLVLLYIIR